MPEEEAFAVLVKIMQDYRMRDMFKPTMAELGVCMFQLENLVSEQLPDLNQHFQSQNFHTSMYASSWFLTLFTTALSLPLACRIMDVFLSEGMEIIFKVALAMLVLGKEDLMSLDMEGMLKVSLKKETHKCLNKSVQFYYSLTNQQDLIIHKFTLFLSATIWLLHYIVGCSIKDCTDFYNECRGSCCEYV